MVQQYKTLEGDTLNSIILGYYGKINSMILAEVLAANQNLAENPSRFPLGTVVVLPVLSESTDIPVKTLWT